MKDDQLTLRLPRDLARLIERRARERGLPRSQVIREALEAYLAEPAPAASGWDRVRHMVGSLPLDSRAIERDALTRQIRDHNWRD